MESKDNVQQEQPTQGTATKVQMSTRVEEKKKANKKNKIRSTIANSIVFIILIAGFYWLVREYFHIGDKDYTEAAQVEEFINPVNTRVAGYIKEIKFIEHQQVKKGDTLLILDDREIQTQLGQAEAAYQNALAQRSATSSSVNTVSNNVNVMESNIAGAKARLWNAEQNLNRYKNLLAAEAVTRQQYDQIKTEYDAQKAAYETLVNQKQSANLSTTEVKSKLGINDAEIKRTKAALDMAKLNLSYTVITAPYDGVMGRRAISDGQLVQAGQQIATIVLNGQKWVTANFLESQMPKIAIGKKIMMSADALGGQQFEGEVTAISAATGSRYSSVPTDNSTGNFIKVQQRIPVRIEFTSGNDKQKLNQLRAGMNMVIKLKD
ncbi:HlyD family secretion protein [Elizabethkingia anophelis]|uniref:HlyD family secretion protein n=1 Tax=Elizabethkingia anophelis TaxID=1117645 RepID=UPI00200DE71E|nr:HlyD family secretion protein [Elizabethkingia anophelis]MCL1032477.1 HlyD family secretion protein [Elizabethkingia anophelis]MCW2462956.1 membrane fusion protein (multidrug efflux system) [Elizabethkingia anophelis]MCW2466641.1 membrane fusion protein (multidrug efflux system) [Elizabethkingia anophelis]MCW2471211.1 membrane fusion protein (multidrug efflux system) [Elizabethkingia anophelis]HBI9691072.1 HlyD family secretion protein [Elizabethkingia anophelis]